MLALIEWVNLLFFTEALEHIMTGKYTMKIIRCLRVTHLFYKCVESAEKWLQLEKILWKNIKFSE